MWTIPRVKLTEMLAVSPHNIATPNLFISTPLESSNPVMSQKPHNNWIESTDLAGTVL